jgi:hypothetical protein
LEAFVELLGGAFFWKSGGVGVAKGGQVHSVPEEGTPYGGRNTHRLTHKVYLLLWGEGFHYPRFAERRPYGPAGVGCVSIASGSVYVFKSLHGMRERVHGYVGYV